MAANKARVQTGAVVAGAEERALMKPLTKG
jgi:hypothetical protein